MTTLALQNGFSALVSLGSFRVGIALAKNDDSEQASREASSNMPSFAPGDASADGGRHGRNLALAARGSESPVLNAVRSAQVIPVKNIAAVRPPLKSSPTYRPARASGGGAQLLRTNTPKGQLVDTLV